MVRHGIKMLLIPPGGWAYDQPIEGSGPMRIEGQSYDQLENKVFEFRVQNTDIITTGSATRENVQSDLSAFICTRFPNQCTTGWTSPSPVPETKTGYTSPISRLHDWFKTLSSSQPEFVEAASANSKAATCMACPQNIGWRTGCAPCVESVERSILRLKGSRSTASDMSLQFCRAFGHHNKLAVWLKDTCSKPTHDIPDQCWLKGVKA